MTTFYLVRHGETHWNVQQRWQGHLDSNLTERGVQQVQELAEKLKDVHFDVAYSSDLPRAVASAQILCERLKIDLHSSTALRERNAGPVEGTTATDRAAQPHIHHHFNDYLKLKSSDKWAKKPFPDFESNQEVALRLEAELVRLAAAHPGQQLLVVAHGGNIRYFLAHIGAIPNNQADTWSLGNAGLAIVSHDSGQFSASPVDQLAQT